MDAVNIIDADIAVITSIDIDHEDWLGSDREQIGREKAGIMRSGKPTVSAGLTPPASLQIEADKIGTTIYQAGRDFMYRQAREHGRWNWSGQSIDGQPVELLALQFPSLPAESVSAALQTLQLLDLPITKIDYNSLANVDLTGRFQCRVIEGKQVVLDVAHNPAAASYLAKRLQQTHGVGRTIALVAVMADKDIDGIVEPLINSFDTWYALELADVPRAMKASALAKKISSLTDVDVHVSSTIAIAFSDALSMMEKEDRLVVFGSFFTVAGLLEFADGKFYDEI